MINGTTPCISTGGHMITNNLLLFSLIAHSLLFILALGEWFEAYQKTDPELKKSFLLQTSLAFAYLT